MNNTEIANRSKKKDIKSWKCSALGRVTAYNAQNPTGL